MIDPTQTQKLEERKTVLDIVVQKAIAEVLSENQGNRLTHALITGMASQMSRALLDEYRITMLPKDIIDRIHTLEQELAELNSTLGLVTEPDIREG